MYATTLFNGEPDYTTIEERQKYIVWRRSISRYSQWTNGLLILLRKNAHDSFRIDPLRTRDRI